MKMNKLNCDINNMRNRIVWSNDGFALDKDYIWFVPYEINVLCKYNINKKIIDEYYLLNDCMAEEAAVYNTTIWNDRVVAIPARSKNLVVIKNNEKKEYSVDEENLGKEKYRCCVGLKNDIYIFPLGEQYIIKYYSDQIEKIKFSYGAIVSCTVLKNNIYFINSENRLFKTNESFCNIVPLDVTGVIHVCACNAFGEGVLLLTKEGKVFWASADMLETGETSAIVQMNTGDYWGTCLCMEEKIVLFPYYDCTKIWIYDCETKLMDSIDIEMDENFNEEWTYNSFGSPIERNGNIYFMSPKHRAFFEINVKNKKVGRHHIYLKLEKDDSLIMLKNKIDSFLVAHENQYHSIETLIDFI